jgi:circadian clock protein KaiC
MLCQQFLAAAARESSSGLDITLEESEEQYRADAESVGIDLSGVHVIDLSALPEFFTEDQAFDLFAPAEVERRPMTKRIVEVVEELKPSRVVVDSMTRFRMYATNPYTFRKQVDSFVRYLLSRGATVMLVSETLRDEHDSDLCFMADGIITLSVDAELRSLEVGKLRGAPHRPGKHAVRIAQGGITVFPRLIPAEHSKDFQPGLMTSGIAELDEVLHGGIERGLVTLITGPSGVGKTTIGMKFAMSAIENGGRAALFAFEESVGTLVSRCEALGMPFTAAIESGQLVLHRVEPLQISSDELAHMVVRVVDDLRCDLVMLDSVSAYRLALRGEDLVERLHALCGYLRNMGVTVVLVNEASGAGPGLRFTEVGLSYLADNLLLLSYFEHLSETGSRIGRAISVAKKRMSDYEGLVYEVVFGGGGIKLEGPLNVRGCVQGALVVGG